MDLKAQKYKICINSNWLVLINLRDRDLLVSKEYPVMILLQAPENGKIIEVIKQLWDETYSLPVVICTKNPLDAWKRLLQSIPLIYAAGGVVQDRRKRYLFIHRRGWWDLPKGKIDAGESNRKAALREVHEEVGLTCTIVTKLKPTYHIYELKKKLVLKKTDWFLMHSDSDQPTLQEDEDITDHIWASKRRLPGMKSKVYPNLAVLIDELMLKN